MKKSTVLILLVVFLGSVLIVGIFGMKAVPFQEIVYCKEIVPTDVTSTTGVKYEIKRNDKGEYYIMVPYEEGIVLMIGYRQVPADCTSKDVRTQITYPAKDQPAVITDRGEIEFSRRGSICVRYSATDSPTAPYMDFWIYMYQPNN